MTDFKKRKILVVDDDTALRNMLAEQLATKESVEVLTAADAKSGFKIILEEKPDVVIADIMMPNESGLDLVSDVRRTPDISNTFFIILTNSLKSDHVAEAMEKNVSVFLQKSNVEPSSIWKIIEDHFKELID